jgi:hypothetical protein
MGNMSDVKTPAPAFYRLIVITGMGIAGVVTEHGQVN